jgi:hypothetical protein
LEAAETNWNAAQRTVANAVSYVSSTKRTAARLTVPIAKKLNTQRVYRSL